MRFKTEKGDVVITCHGGLREDPSIRQVVVPDYVEVWFPAPPGTKLFTETAWMLERGDQIDGLERLDGYDQYETPLGGGDPIDPTIFRQGQTLPRILLQRMKERPDNQRAGPRNVQPPGDGSLADHWDTMVGAYRKLAIAEKRTLRVFMAICLNPDESGRFADRKGRAREEIPGSDGVRAINQPVSRKR